MTKRQTDKKSAHLLWVTCKKCSFYVTLPFEKVPIFPAKYTTFVTHMGPQLTFLRKCSFAQLICKKWSFFLTHTETHTLAWYIDPRHHDHPHQGVKILDLVLQKTATLGATLWPTQVFFWGGQLSQPNIEQLCGQPRPFFVGHLGRFPNPTESNSGRTSVANSGLLPTHLLLNWEKGTWPKVIELWLKI